MPLKLCNVRNNVPKTVGTLKEFHDTNLWEYSVYIFTMGDTLANDRAIFFVYGNPDSETADPNFVFIRIPGHALKISQ